MFACLAWNLDCRLFARFVHFVSLPLLVASSPYFHSPHWPSRCPFPPHFCLSFPSPSPSSSSPLKKSSLPYHLILLPTISPLLPLLIITSGQNNLTKRPHGRCTLHCAVQSYSPCCATCTPSNTCFFWPIRVHNPNGISIGSAVFAGLTIVTDGLTDRPRYSVCNNKTHLCSTGKRPNNNKWSK